MSKQYVKQWDVPGSNGKTWRVSLKANGEYACSCPRWIFKREECKHIEDVRGGGFPENGINKPDYVLAAVPKPLFKPATNQLFIPLVRFDALRTDMEATICASLLKHGYSIHEIRNIRKIPSDWTVAAILDHVKKHGEAQYSDDLEEPRKRQLA